MKLTRFQLVLAIAGLSGFVALSYEILWYRIIASATWGLPSAFGLLLAAYLFGIAVGSRISGRFCKDDAAVGDPRPMRTLAVFTFFANVAAWLVAPLFAWLAKWTWLPPLAGVALAAGLLGSILPLVCHFGIAPDQKAGQRLSYVYLANIIGSSAGSLVTGFYFMDRMTTPQIGKTIALIGLGLVMVMVAASGLRGTTRIAAWGAVVAGAFAVAALNPRVYDRIYERLLYQAEFKEDTRFADLIETKSGVIAVTQDGTVYGGGAYDGRFNTSIVYDRNGILRAYGIGAMSQKPAKILMVGLASGSWAQVIAHLPGVESLTIVEINPGYLTLISRHEEVSGLLSNPKVHIEIDDGRRWLNRHPGERFDVIVQNTTWHWRAHITNLLSVEYMGLVRAHLSPGGVFFFNSTSSDDVQKTAATEWPHALRVYNFMAVSDAPFSFDKARWETVLKTYSLDGSPAIDRSTENGQKLYEELLAYADTINEPPNDRGLESRDSVLARTKDARLITDDNMVPEWRKLLRFPKLE
jgi:spermidine synthase